MNEALRAAIKLIDRAYDILDNMPVLLAGDNWLNDADLFLHEHHEYLDPEPPDVDDSVDHTAGLEDTLDLEPDHGELLENQYFENGGIDYLYEGERL